MGTNYYMMVKDREFAHKHFAVEMDGYTANEEYEIVDYPYLGYQIHLNKCSWGWLPLFQRHREFQTWDELESFYLANSDKIEIYDEYCTKYTFNEYKEIIFNHAERSPEPVKWVYDYTSWDLRHYSPSKHKYLHTEACDPKEADLWTPFNHKMYFETEKRASKKFGIGGCFSVGDYYDDPIYTIDWTDGDFS